MSMTSRTGKYDAAGHILERMLPNGVRTEYAYSGHGKLESLAHLDALGKIDAFSYLYDPAGNKTKKQKTRRLADESYETVVYGYAYNSMNQLTGVSRDGSSLRKYAYDSMGNRTMMEDFENQTATCYEYDLLNRLIKAEGDDGEKVFGYDKRGNMTSVSCDGAVEKIFTFNAENKLASAEVAGRGTAAYTYDGFGRRVRSVWDMAEVSFGSKPERIEKRYVLDALKSYENILMAYNNEGVIRYVWGNELVSSKVDKSDPMYYLYDELRSPIRTISAEGRIFSLIDHDEFGVPTPRDTSGLGDVNQCSSQVNLFGFTCYQPDPITCLYYAQNRYYVPELGRFASVDISKGNTFLPASLNLYAYCGNNPLGFLDLDGREPTPEEAARMVDHLYMAKEDNIGDVVENAGNWTLINIERSKIPQSSLKMGLYSRMADDGSIEYALVNKGTTLRSAKEWSQNIAAPLGLSTDIYESVRYAKKYHELLINQDLTMVGYSKGGAEAIANAVATGRDAITFNPMNPLALQAYGLDPKGYNGKMEHYIVTGEILRIFGFPPVGKVYPMNQQYGSLFHNNIVYAIKNHAPGALLAAVMELSIKIAGFSGGGFSGGGGGRWVDDPECGGGGLSGGGLSGGGGSRW